MSRFALLGNIVKLRSFLIGWLFLRETAPWTVWTRPAPGQGTHPFFARQLTLQVWSDQEGVVSCWLYISAIANPPLCLPFFSILLTVFNKTFHSPLCHCDQQGQSHSLLCLRISFLIPHCPYSRWQGHLLCWLFYLKAPVLPKYPNTHCIHPLYRLYPTLIPPTRPQDEDIRSASGPRRRRDGNSKSLIYPRAVGRDDLHDPCTVQQGSFVHMPRQHGQQVYREADAWLRLERFGFWRLLPVQRLQLQRLEV